MPTGHRRTYPGRSREEIVAFIASRVARELYVTPMERAYLADSGLCWLCGAEVPWSVAPNDPLAASRDHVVPRSAGGSGTRGSIRLAHRGCNAARGAGVPRMEAAS